MYYTIYKKYIVQYPLYKVHTNTYKLFSMHWTFYSIKCVKNLEVISINVMEQIKHFLMWHVTLCDLFMLHVIDILTSYKLQLLIIIKQFMQSLINYVCYTWFYSSLRLETLKWSAVHEVKIIISFS